MSNVVEILDVSKWHAKALEFGKVGDKFIDLRPNETPQSWTAWRDYFKWLNWAPYWFLEVERMHLVDPACTKTWTAPCDNPDEFKVRFRPRPGSAPEFPLQSKARPGDYILTTEQRQSYIKQMRGKGHLSFGGGERRESDKSWFQRMSRRQADQYLRECDQTPGKGSPIEENVELVSL